MISLPSFEKNNEQFLFWMIALLPLLGSGITIVLAGVLIWALISLGLKRFPLKYEAADMPLLVACGSYICIQFLLTIYHAETLYDFEAFLPAIIAFTPFLLLPRFRATPHLDYGAITFRAAFLGCCIALVVAAFQYFVFNLRAEGGDGNALIFASVCALLGVISLLGLKRQEQFRWPLLPLFGFCFALLAIAMSGSRGPMLALFAAGCVYLVRNAGKLINSSHFTKRQLFVTATATVLITIIALVPLGIRSWSELNSVSAGDHRLGSSQIRLLYLSQGIELFKQKPILGHGASNRDTIMDTASEVLAFKNGAIEGRGIVSCHRYLPVPLQRYYLNYSRKKWLENRRKEIGAARKLGKPAPAAQEKEYLPTYVTNTARKKAHGHLHNEYLMHAVDGGIAGFFGYICLLFGPVFFGFLNWRWQKSRTARADFGGVIVVMAVLAMFNVAFENDIIAVTFMLLLITLHLSNVSHISEQQTYS